MSWRNCGQHAGLLVGGGMHSPFLTEGTPKLLLGIGIARAFNGCSGVSVLLHVETESGRGQ
jgi:hypothetical protein